MNSIYNPGKQISEAQYLAEYIIKKGADNKGVVLPERFWGTKDDPKTEWKSWGDRIPIENIHAKRLLKTHSFKNIMSAIDDHRSRFVMSLTNKNLVKIINEYSAREKRKSIIEESIRVDVKKTSTKTLPSRKPGKKSRLSKLRD